MKDFHEKYLETDEDFRLITTISIQVDILGYEIETEFVSLTKEGVLTMKAGFRWNASGPTIDTLNTREASCYHDALYELANHGAFLGEHSKCVKKKADLLMYRTLRKNGMFWLRAQAWYRSVRLMGFRYWEKGTKRYKGMSK